MFFLESPHQKNLPRNMTSASQPFQPSQSTNQPPIFPLGETVKQPPNLCKGPQKKPTLHTGDAGLLGSFPSSAPDARISCCYQARKNSKFLEFHVLGTFKPWVSRLDGQVIHQLGRRWLQRWLAVAMSGTPKGRITSRVTRSY